MCSGDATYVCLGSWSRVRAMDKVGVKVTVKISVKVKVSVKC